MYPTRKEDFKPLLKTKTQFGHLFSSEQILFILLYKKKCVQIKKQVRKTYCFLVSSFISFKTKM